MKQKEVDYAMIDLRPVVNKYSTIIGNSSHLKSLLLDLYPQEALDRNVVLAIYDTGIVDRIKRNPKLTLSDMKKYIKIVEDNYGINAVLVQNGIIAWAEAFSVSVEKEATLPMVTSQPSAKVSGAIDIDIPSIISGASGDFEYEVLPDDTIEITGYNGEESKLTIPGTIAGRKVSVIGKDVFSSNGDIEGLIVSENIRVIDQNAFENCYNLKAIRFPNSLERINSFAFAKCSELRTIIWGNGLFRIDFHAFDDCERLYSLELPSSLEYIDSSVFWGCRMLKSVTFKNRQSKLKEIQSTAFNDCSNLETIELPSDSVEFRYQAFDGLRKERLTVYCHANSDTYTGLLEEGMNVKIIPRK